MPPLSHSNYALSARLGPAESTEEERERDTDLFIIRCNTLHS